MCPKDSATGDFGWVAPGRKLQKATVLKQISAIPPGDIWAGILVRDFAFCR